MGGERAPAVKLHKRRTSRRLGLGPKLAPPLLLLLLLAGPGLALAAGPPEAGFAAGRRQDAPPPPAVTSAPAALISGQGPGNSSEPRPAGAAEPGPEQDDDRALLFGIITANSLIFGIGLCGNSMVILVILRFTKIETVTDIYILNLAFADLMFILGLVFLITTMFIDHWIFGNLMCKLYMATTSLNQFASSLLLVVMSFDRFLAVCHPIYAQRFRRLRRAKVICLCIWIACLVLMTPIFAFAKTNKDLTCAIFWPDYRSFNCEMAFTVYSFAIGFALPLLLIAAFYICVIRKLRQAASGPIGLGSTRRSRSRENTNRRIEHLVIGIICTYTICWLPYWLTQLCVSFMTLTNEPPIRGFYSFVLISTSLSYTNSALNPILYAFLSDNFKRRCSEVLRSVASIGWRRGGRRAAPRSAATTTLCCESEAPAEPPRGAPRAANHCGRPQAELAPQDAPQDAPPARNRSVNFSVDTFVVQGGAPGSSAAGRTAPDSSGV